MGDRRAPSPQEAPMGDPFLAEVWLRAWGTDDPRVLNPLQHENQPAHTYREQAIEDRARAAGWPSGGFEWPRKQATTAMQRLEGGDFTLRTRQRRYHQREAAYESRRSGM